MITDDITLPNGLRVLACRKNIGKSAAYIEIPAGLYHGHKPELAHILEHLQGKPAGIGEGFPQFSYSNSNATTKFTDTAYYFEELVPEDLTLAARLLSNIFGAVAGEVLEREKNAVVEELTPKDNPDNRFYQALQKLSAPNISALYTPLHERIASVPGTTHEDCAQFFTSHYHPKNAVLVLSGELPKSLDEILEPFSRLASEGTQTPPIDWPAQETPKEQTVHIENIRKFNAATILVLKHAPNFPIFGTYRETAAYGALNSYLRNPHGDLFDELRNKRRLCYGFSITINEFGPISLFDFQATTSRIDRVHELAAAYDFVLENIAQRGMPEQFLEAYRKGVRIRFLGEDHSFSIGSALDEHRYGITVDEKVQTCLELTQEDVRLAARKLCGQKNTVGIALPEKK